MDEDIGQLPDLSNRGLTKKLRKLKVGEFIEWRVPGRNSYLSAKNCANRAGIKITIQHVEPGRTIIWRGTPQEITEAHRYDHPEGKRD